MKKQVVFFLFVNIVMGCSLNAIRMLSYLDNPGTFKNFREMLRKAQIGGTPGAANIDTLLAKAQTYTLFVPTDEAIALFGRTGLLEGAGKEKQYEKFVAYHLLKGKVVQRALLRKRRVKSYVGAQVFSEKKGKDVYVFRKGELEDRKAKVLYSVEVDNGIVHVIDKVLVHPDLTKMLNVPGKL